jgi:hypothetical protein
MKKIVDGQVIEITQDEIAEMEKEAEEFKKTAEYKQTRIAELKQFFSETDYKIIKLAEGELTPEECADVIEQRKAWRKEINELEVSSHDTGALS